MLRATPLPDALVPLQPLLLLPVLLLLPRRRPFSSLRALRSVRSTIAQTRCRSPLCHRPPTLAPAPTSTPTPRCARRPRRPLPLFLLCSHRDLACVLTPPSLSTPTAVVLAIRLSRFHRRHRPSPRTTAPTTTAGRRPRLHNLSHRQSLRTASLPKGLSHRRRPRTLPGSPLSCVPRSAHRCLRYLSRLLLLPRPLRRLHGIPHIAATRCLPSSRSHPRTGNLPRLSRW